MSDELKKKIELAQNGNKEMLNELVKENYGLIKSIARRFENRRIWNGRYISDRSNWIN